MKQPLTRILHFIESEGVYGAERVILNLSRQMQADQHYAPVIGCIVANPHSPCALYDAAQALGLEAIKIPIANSKLLWQIPQAARLLKAQRINLIHSHGYKPSVFGFAIRLLTNIPIMATCHLWFDPARAPLKARIMIHLEKLFYHRFPKIVGVSDEILDVLRQAGIASNKLALIKNGVDIPEQQDKTTLDELRHQLGIAKDSYILINPARLARQKDQLTLIQAAKLLSAKGVKCTTLIVGQGPLAEELTQAIRQYELKEEVRLLGFRADINQLLALADAFVLPSLDEGMPMSLLEAAAQKKPIVCTLVGDIGKMIQHQQSGLVVEKQNPQQLADSIEQLINAPELAQRIALNAHKILVRDYSSQAMYKQYKEIYCEILQTTHETA